MNDCSRDESKSKTSSHHLWQHQRVFALNITIKLIPRRAWSGSGVRAAINDPSSIELGRPEACAIVCLCDYTAFINLEYSTFYSPVLWRPVKNGVHSCLFACHPTFALSFAAVVLPEALLNCQWIVSQSQTMGVGGGPRLCRLLDSSQLKCVNERSA